MKVKYNRISSLSQTGNRFSADKDNYDLTLLEKISGSVKFRDRPKAKELINLIEKGKITEIVVEEFSRLGRSTGDVISTLELLRRGNKIWTGTDRTSEVDFVCRTPLGDINYIQVAWLLSDEKTMEREFSALEKIKDNYPKLLLTTDSYTQNRSGIKMLNVFQWLLDLD